MFSKAVLGNGLRYILAPMPQVKSATVLVMVRAGSRYESEENNGVSHFLEHMMFKGTKKRPSKIEISKLLDGIGASFNAFTSKEYTGFYVKSSAEHLELITDVVSDMVLSSTYPAEEIERERGVIIEEINMDEDDPAGRVFQVFEKLIFAGSPLALRIAGEKATVTAMTREKVVDYVQKMYDANSMIVTIAGQTLNSKSETLIDKYFGEVGSGEENKYEPAVGKQQTAQVSVYEKKTEQAHFVLGVRGYAISDPKRYAAGVLANILGGNMSSRLFQEVREKRGLAYYVSAASEEYLDTGFVLAGAGVRLADVDEALRVVLEQFALIRDKGISPEELTMAKEYSKGKMVLALEDSFRVASFFAGQELLEREILLPDQVLEKINKVTAKEVALVAGELFKTERLNLAIIGPFKDEERFAKILKV